MEGQTVVDVGRDRRLVFYFQGERARELAPLIDLRRIRRVVRPLMSRQTLIIVHANDRCRGVTGSWYGRCRTFSYWNHYYRKFDGDVITLSLNPRWLRRKRVVHGPYYLSASYSYKRYPTQKPMDAIIYVLTHEFSHQYLYTRRHSMRYSEVATDLFAMQHLYLVEPRHPIARKVRLTNRELGLMLELVRRIPPDGPLARVGRRVRVA